MNRIAPAPDIYATCPLDGCILDYYAGAFEAVYVSLSPFFRPMSISAKLFRPETYPDRHTIMATCQAVSWSEVMSLSGLPSLSAVDIGLRTQIGGLNDRYANQDFADCLDKMTESTGVRSPPEGEHSDLLHDQVLSLFQELGHTWVWVGDEFSSERKLHFIDDLKSEEKPTINGRCNVFSPDKSILWTVHWDSHFSFLCSSREILDRIRVSDRLEGFFCTPKTEVFWSVLNE